MSDAVADVLDKAAEVIETRGWHQGWYSEPGTGCVCALGALNVAAGGDPEFESVGTDEEWVLSIRAQRALERVVGDMVPKWNDRSNRTAAEVIAALRNAAAAERAAS